ncbi:MAG TPA: hypothetical protein PLR60_07335 [Syntrophorhabdaceae bacterium]|nr:hypothetical protein [Syntrophorhabdaceae bacterium]
MELAEKGRKKMRPEKVKEMTAADRKNRIRTFTKNSQMKKLINSLPPTIISSFTGTRGKNILYLDPPGTNLTLSAVVAVRGFGVSAGRHSIKSEINAMAFCAITPCLNARLWTGREN